MQDILKVAIITDLHYYSKKIGISGKAYLRMSEYNQKLHGESEELIKAAWKLLCQDTETKIVLIHGDITNNGEVVSHYEMRELLQQLVDCGKKVFVTVSTHDYRKSAVAKGYDGDNIVEITAFTHEDIKYFYHDFGPKQALAYHEQTGSYVVQLQEGFRLLALNDDFGENKSGYKDEHMLWIKEQVDKAKQENQYIFAMAHHPIIASTPLYKIVGKGNMIEKYNKRVSEFADMGINIYLSGHSHMHKIAFEVSENGNPFYNLSTAALVGYPPTIRKLSIDTKTKIAVVETLLLQGAEGVETQGKQLPEFLRSKFLGMIEDLVASAAKGDMDRVSEITIGISVKPEKIRKAKFIIKPIGKWVNKITYEKLLKWTRKETKLNPQDFEEEKSKKALPLFISMIANIYDGNPKYTPFTLEYKLIMGMLAIFDSILRCIPFDLKKKTGYNSLSEIIEPLVYNDSIDNYNAVLHLDSRRAKESIGAPKEYKSPYHSKKGKYIIAFFSLVVILALPVLIPTAIIFGASKIVKKMFKKEKNK